MTIKDLVGTFSIIGSNQDDEKNSYKGELNLSLDDNDRVVAKWMIDNTQEQFGTGFFKDNILVINFNYKGYDDNIFTGTVVYKCLNKDILEGFWSEELGDPFFLGIENCFRVKSSKTVLN
jgi:hypothetical protein